MRRLIKFDRTQLNNKTYIYNQYEYFVQYYNLSDNKMPVISVINTKL